MATLIDSLKNFFTDCSEVPQEQFEFYTFIPLYQPWSEITDGSDEEDDGGDRVKIVVPELSKLEKGFKEASGGKDVLESEALVAFVQKNGFSPSKEDEKKMKAKYKNGLTFTQTQEWMKEIEHREDTANHLKSFFLHYDVEGLVNDQGKGTLTRNQLKHILTKHGGEDALTDREFEALLSEKGQNKQDVEYNRLVGDVMKNN